MHLDIEVNQQDIETGVPSDEHWCPIARAVRRLVPDVECVTVDSGVLSVVLTTDREEHLEAELPLNAKEFVAMFDDLEAVQPFRFSASLIRKPGWSHDI